MYIILRGDVYIKPQLQPSVTFKDSDISPTIKGLTIATDNQDENSMSMSQDDISP